MSTAETYLVATTVLCFIAFLCWLFVMLVWRGDGWKARLIAVPVFIFILDFIYLLYSLFN